MKQFILLPMLVCSVYFIACKSSSNESNTANISENKVKIELASSETSTGKYQIKSGMYTTRSKNDMMSAAMDNSTIVYFDDYGNKELTENISKIEMSGHKMETHSFSLTIDKMIYNWDADKKTGSKYNIEDMMNNMMNKNVDYEAMGEELKKQYNYKELGTETILGKECKKISVEVTKGSTAVACTWKGITMRSETSMGGMQMIIEVVDLHENATIDASKLKVPSDVTFTEMKMPGK
ncbi:MAG: hypothetical protein H7Y00_05750 [Fimbriimonadaceae bacterium]|nr:hypothetical protein [Chitinophagales bacterium]